MINWKRAWWNPIAWIVLVCMAIGFIGLGFIYILMAMYLYVCGGYSFKECLGEAKKQLLY